VKKKGDPKGEKFRRKKGEPRSWSKRKKEKKDHEIDLCAPKKKKGMLFG